MPYTAGDYDEDHVYVQWGGTLPGSEAWSCGLRMASTNPAGIAQDQAFCDAVATVLGNFHNRLTSAILPAAQMTYCKVNPILANGHYKFPTTIQKILAPVKNGGSNLGTLVPNQIALAITLTTDVARGPAHQGRFYLPLPGLSPSTTDGLLPSAGITDVKTSVNTMITDLNAVSANYDVAVFSRKAGAATHRLVTGCKVGRVLDTVRRRRNKLTEKYV